MKTKDSILMAFILNILFSIFELIGGYFIGSIAIMADAFHDFTDSISIGISYFLEKKSTKKADAFYTYGYKRYSILGALITNTILIVGSIFMIFAAIDKIKNPSFIHYNGMIVFAVIGVFVNSFAVYFVRDGKSLNQKAVRLHMIEDSLGWIIVLIGSVIIKYTGVNIIDPILTIVVSVFIFISALTSYKKIFNIFLERIPDSINLDKIKEQIMKLQDVESIHHIHIWSLDGINNYSTMHVVSKTEDTSVLKLKIKEELKKMGIIHSTIEFENVNDDCNETECNMNLLNSGHHH